MRVSQITRIVFAVLAVATISACVVEERGPRSRTVVVERRGHYERRGR